MGTRAKELIGKEVNGFFIKDIKRENNRTYALAVCPVCGEAKWLRMDTIRSSRTKSCGCSKDSGYFKKEDAAGKMFGKLVAIRSTDGRDPNNGSVIWECLCDCGNTVLVSYSNLKRGSIRSCGCLQEQTRTDNGKEVGEFVKENFCKEGTNVTSLTMRTPRSNTSGYKGVRYRKDRGKWVAEIRFKGKNYYLGSYLDKKDAIEARKAAEDKLFGGFLEWYKKTYPEQYKKVKNKK